jgi:hypothetical protein
MLAKPPQIVVKPPEPKQEELIREEIAADDYFDGLREESKDFIGESGVSASLNDRDSSDDDLPPRQLLTLDERNNFNPSETLAYSEDQLGTFLSESSKQKPESRLESATSQNRYKLEQSLDQYDERYN